MAMKWSSLLDFATPDYTVGAVGQATVNLQTGDVIADGSTLYRYNGANIGNFRLTDQAITGDTVDFIAIGGQGGATYEYVGPDPRTDFLVTNYNTSNWIPVTTNAAVAGRVNIVSTHTALGGGATPSYHNPQNLEKGDTVLLDKTYDTPTFTVTGRPTSVNLQTGNVIQDGATLYRYVGTGASFYQPDRRKYSGQFDQFQGDRRPVGIGLPICRQRRCRARTSRPSRVRA